MIDGRERLLLGFDRVGLVVHLRAEVHDRVAIEIGERPHMESQFFLERVRRGLPRTPRLRGRDSG